MRCLARFGSFSCDFGMSTLGLVSWHVLASMEAIATRVEAIAAGLEAIATRVEAIAIRLEAIA